MMARLVTTKSRMRFIRVTPTELVSAVECQVSRCHVPGIGRAAISEYRGRARGTGTPPRAAARAGSRVASMTGVRTCTCGGLSRLKTLTHTIGSILDRAELH